MNLTHLFNKSKNTKTITDFITSYLNFLFLDENLYTFIEKLDDNDKKLFISKNYENQLKKITNYILEEKEKPLNELQLKIVFDFSNIYFTNKIFEHIENPIVQKKLKEKLLKLSINLTERNNIEKLFELYLDFINHKKINTQLLDLLYETKQIEVKYINIKNQIKNDLINYIIENKHYNLINNLKINNKKLYLIDFFKKISKNQNYIEFLYSSNNIFNLSSSEKINIIKELEDYKLKFNFELATKIEKKYEFQRIYSVLKQNENNLTFAKDFIYNLYNSDVKDFLNKQCLPILGYLRKSEATFFNNLIVFVEKDYLKENIGIAENKEKNKTNRI